MKPKFQLGPPWEREFYGKWKFKVGELKPDKPAIQKSINEAMKKRTVRVKSVLP
jgi:hypothetical protein